MLRAAWVVLLKYQLNSARRKTPLTVLAVVTLRNYPVLFTKLSLKWAYTKNYCKVQGMTCDLFSKNLSTTLSANAVLN